METSPTLSRAKVLIVDDEERNRKLLEAMLTAEGYDTLQATHGGQAVALATRSLPDLILLDVMMPEVDGYQVAEELKGSDRTRSIPIIMVTALNDRSSKLRGLAAGAEDFLTKPIDRAELIVRVRNLLRLKRYGDMLENYNRTLQEEVRAKTSELRESYVETILALTRAAEFKDVETGAHVRRISYYTSILSERLGMSADFTDVIRHASPMHDIGKIGIPDRILLKPTAFTPEEWEVMKSHTTLGGAILRTGASPYLRMGAEIAEHHHERWDGSGYPHGLKGEVIPLSARIMSICDVYDALRSARPYKPALDQETVVRIIREGDGRTKAEHFDPDVLEAFCACAEEFQQVFEEYRD